MTQSLSRRNFVAAAISTTFAAPPVAAPRIARSAEPYRLRCSLDTAPWHARNTAIGDFLSKVEQASDGRIKTELFHAGTLSADANVADAMMRGQVEMACPGTWVLSELVPDCEVVNLPVLYGQPVEICRRVLDGRTGTHINQQLRTRMQVRVLGHWLYLGQEHWYSTTRPIGALADLKGMTIRNGGGGAIAWRTRFFGASPNTTPWPDVRLALAQRKCDGLITTNESCFSARLWEVGLRTSVQDRQNVNNYIPIISEAFLTSLPTDMQILLVETWRHNIEAYRTAMLEAQERALIGLREHGMVDVTPADEEIASVRETMLGEQPRLMRELHMSPELPRVLAEDLGVGAQRGPIRPPPRAALAEAEDLRDAFLYTGH